MLKPGVRIETGDTISEKKYYHYGECIRYFDGLNEGIQEPPPFYRDLLMCAQREVMIWDTYVYAEDICLLDQVNHGVKVDILTTGSLDGKTYTGKLKKLSEEIKKIKNENRIDIRVRFLNTRTLQPKNGFRFHDRFLKVDDRYFMVGTSLQSHHSENDTGHSSTLCTTALMEITGERDRQILQTNFDKYWHSPYVENLL